MMFNKGRNTMNYQSKVAGDPARPEKRGLGGAIDRLFEVTRSGSTIRTEIIAALTTFLAASYVIVVNPAILQNAASPFPQGSRPPSWSALSAAALWGFMRAVPFSSRPEWA